jgi:hypothetical protein
MLLLRSGVDLSGGKPPSMIQMFRLTANPTLREAAKLVAVELKKAGIDITPQVCSSFQHIFLPGTYVVAIGRHRDTGEYEKGQEIVLLLGGR